MEESLCGLRIIYVIMDLPPAQRRAKADRKRWTVETDTLESARSAPGLGFQTSNELSEVRRANDSRKPKKSKSLPSAKNSGGIFQGVHAVFIPGGVSRKRLQVWETKFTERGGTIIDSATAPRTQCNLVHIVGIDEAAVSKQVDLNQLKLHKRVRFVQYRWIEECLKDGKLLSLEPYDFMSGSAQTPKSEVQLIQPGPPNHSPSEVKIVEDSAGDNGESHASEVARPEERASQRSPDMEQSSATMPGPLREEDGHIEDGAPDDGALDFNKHLAGPLRELSSIYTDVLGDEWRAITYRKVANNLDHLPYRVSNSEELKSIFGIGKSMLEKVSEILRSGTLQKLANLKADPKVQVIQTFASVWGIGPKHARRLYEAGFRTLQDIKGDPSLSSMARIGLKYHDDIVSRIPRAEVAEAGSFVQKILEDLCPGMSEIILSIHSTEHGARSKDDIENAFRTAWLTIGGSYRRGQSTCGDIDLLITHPDGHSQEGLMTRLLRALREAKFVSDGSSVRNESDSPTVETFMGICKLQQHCHYRRLDIKIYRMDLYAFALLYFTGNDVLNRRVRYFARQKGYKLSDQGLFLLGSNSMEKDVLIPCQTEQQIFEKLGLSYPDPCDRNW